MTIYTDHADSAHSALESCELDLLDGLFGVLSDSDVALLLDSAEFLFKSIHEVGGSSGLLRLVRLGVDLLGESFTCQLYFILDLRELEDLLLERGDQPVVVLLLLLVVVALVHELPVLLRALLDLDIALQVQIGWLLLGFRVHDLHRLDTVLSLPVLGGKVIELGETLGSDESLS